MFLDVTESSENRVKIATIYYESKLTLKFTSNFVGLNEVTPMLSILKTSIVNLDVQLKF